MQKKVTIVLLSILFCFAGLTVNAQTLGDVNNNGAVDIVDALMMAQYYVGLNPPGFISSVADVNCSHAIDIVDALMTAQYYVKLITNFPCTTPTPTATNSGTMLLVGRFDPSSTAGPRMAWTASTLKANFQGTSISARLSSTGDNWYNVIIDNAVKAPVNVSAGTTATFSLATGLSAGNHTVELVKRTEASTGDVQFLGFTVGGGSLLAPPAAAARRIEFIGDSITCGYGNEGANQYQGFTTKNENGYLAYGSITARALNADQITVAWSGKGMIRNYGGNTTDPLPAVYRRILPYNTTLLWNTSQWIPQVVVINLGTNDYSVGIPDKNTFTTAYLNFVKQIRSQYTTAHIYCAIGPMLDGNNLASARDYINTVVNQQTASGDTKIHYTEFPVQDAANGYGEDWHPSLATHRLMAAQLTAQIKSDLGW